jgi:hypothetical protein
VRLTKPKTAQREVNVAGRACRHVVVRLPARHYKYNPIELVWGQVNPEVAGQNTISRLSNIDILMNTTQHYSNSVAVEC